MITTRPKAIALMLALTLTAVSCTSHTRTESSTSVSTAVVPILANPARPPIAAGTVHSAAAPSVATIGAVAGRGSVTMGAANVVMMSPAARVLIRPAPLDKPASDQLLSLTNVAGVSHGPVVEFDAATADIRMGATITIALSGALSSTGVATLAYWDSQAASWLAVPSKLSLDRRAVSTKVSHFSWWTDLVSTADHAVGSVFDVRVDKPKCAAPVPSWVQPEGIDFVDDKNAPLLWCAGHDPAKPSLLVIKVRVNRGYGIAIRASTAPTWSYSSSLNLNALDLTAAFLADAQGTVAKTLTTLVTGGQVVPGGAEVDYGFSESQVRQAPGGGQNLVEAATPDLTELALSMVLKQMSDSVDNKSVAYAVALLGFTQCLARIGSTNSASLLAGAFVDCGAATKDQITELRAGHMSGLAKYAKLPESDVAAMAAAATKKFFAIVTMANLFFQAATYAGDVNLIPAVRQFSAFPRILPNAAQPMTVANLGKAQVFARFGVSAGSMSNGSRTGENGGVIGISDPPPAFGDFTGDGVTDAAASMQGTSGHGGTYGWIGLFTGAGRHLGDWDGAYITQARMQVTSLAIADGHVNVAWTALDNAHPFESTWTAQLRWSGEKVVADHVTMLTSETGGRPVDEQAYHRAGAYGTYWRSPSGNIYCQRTGMKGNTLCLMATFDFAGPTNCAHGPIYASIDSSGVVSTGCGGDSPQLPQTPNVLEFGQSISDFSQFCTSTDHGMNCKDLTSGHGFNLSRTAVTEF